MLLVVKQVNMKVKYNLSIKKLTLNKIKILSYNKMMWFVSEV